MGTGNVEDVYELSPLQQGMLLHCRYDGAADMYLGQHVYTVEGPFDLDALARAWQLVLTAHPAMRTSIHWKGWDKPLQVVHRKVDPRAHRHDWSDCDVAEQRQRLDLLLSDDRAQGFDLTKAPLQRLHLIRLGPDRHGLAWSYHHLLLDGWSVPIFMNDVMAHYRRLTAGGPPPPAPPPFRDYIAWLQRQDLAAAQRFWAEKLADVTPAHLVPLRTLDPRLGTGAVDRHTIEMPAEMEHGLRAAAGRHRVTLSTILQAVWAIALRRYTGSAEVTFGCVTSGRPAEVPHVDRIVGAFINTLPVPVTVPEDGDLGIWLRNLQDRYAGIRRYEFSPLPNIKKWAGRPGQDLFETLVVLDNYSFIVEAGEIGDALTVRTEDRYDKVSVPLSWIVTPEPVSELQLIVHRDRFDAGFAAELLACLQHTLTAMTRAARVAEVTTAAGPIIALAPAVKPAAPAEATASGTIVAPATAREEAIAAVYRDVLDLDAVDTTAGFFELGGDSFGAVRAITRIEGATVAMLAANPSVRELARALTVPAAHQPDAGRGDDQPVREAPSPRDGSLVSAHQSEVASTVRGDLAAPLMASQEFLWLISSSTPPQANNVVIWELPPDTTKADATTAFTELVVRYEALRTTFGLSSTGLPYQRVTAAPPLRIPEYDLAGDPTAGLDVMKEMTESVIQPHAGQLYRVALLTDGGMRWIVLALSHLAADGVSVDILQRVFFSLLRGQAAPKAGRQPVEQALIENAPDYRPTLDRAVSNLEETLRRAPSALFPMPEHQVPPGSCLRSQIRSTAVDSAARDLAKQLRTTLPTIYSVMYVACLTALSQNPRYTIWVNFHGRFDDALRDAVGCYFTRGLLGGSVREGTSFLALMKNVQESTLRAMRLSTFSYCAGEEARVRLERARGLPIRLASTFDYAEVPADDLPSAEITTNDGISVARTDPIPNNDLTVMVRTGAGEPALDLIGSAAALTAEDLVCVTRAMAEVVVTLSVEPEARDRDLAELLREHGMPARTYGPDWVYHDGSWISLAATRELLVSHGSVHDACVAVRERDGEGIVLVAYVAPKSPDLPAWQLRQYLLDRIHARLGAAVPRRFLLVNSPPPGDGKDANDWQRQTVIDDTDAMRFPRQEPSSLKEAALCSAIEHIHPGITVDVNSDYLSMGGRALLAPAVVHAIEGCGYVGITALDLLQPCSTANLARRLSPRHLPPEL